jgi:hypothetical protein
MQRYPGGMSAGNINLECCSQACPHTDCLVRSLRSVVLLVGAMDNARKATAAFEK